MSAHVLPMQCFMVERSKDDGHSWLAFDGAWEEPDAIRICAEAEDEYRGLFRVRKYVREEGGG